MVAVNKEDSADMLENFLTSKKIKIPMIVTGTSSDGIIGENIIGISCKYNIQGIFKIGAKLFSVTASMKNHS